MQAGNTLVRMRKCTGSSEPWLLVAYVMNSTLTYKLLINYNQPFLLLCLCGYIQVIQSNKTNYRQTYQLYIIIPVGRNCIGRFGYGPKLLWADMSCIVVLEQDTYILA